MTQPLKQLNPNDRKAAEEEARRIRKTADKTSTGGQLGGTFFGQEPDDGMAKPKTVASGNK
ncbi:hypothetical protein [Roseibium aggregatum]|uniref:Uncharacterized protein n=1 Tax=Roseibium aggregatum TaxID=187304 RepID=A0A939J650_9HYPH|nr:hypothetical protein [Roseibium aggregatum]MBN9672915.1 hypothetical protein [Roseibium aggregatum]